MKPHPEVPGEHLPIDDHLQEIVECACSSRQVVLMAPTGSGKTTRLPWSLAGALEPPREVWVLEPRRIAARLAARHVAGRLGERAGERVGYEVRLERKVSNRTRVRYLTEALLARHLLTNSTLAGVGAVLLDEFHERHLQGDLALALLTRLQATSRPDLILGLLSATLEGIDPEAIWPHRQVIRTEGRAFPVSIEHLEQEPRERLPTLVHSALRRLIREGLSNQVLCFLPGAGAIAACARELDETSRRQKVAVARLHGSLGIEAQDEALRPSAGPRIILSTNVAESSITVPGIEAVVDSGLARHPSFDPWSGLPRLIERKVSRASLTQRAGRAGRVAPGRCLRLFTEHDARGRSEQETPEIARTDLADTRLLLDALGLRRDQLPWLTPPPEKGWSVAGDLLRRLELESPAGTLTATGVEAARWAIPPRLAAVFAHCINGGAGARGAALAALLAERDVLERGPWQRDRPLPTGPSDPLDRLERLEEAARSGWRSDRMRILELDPARSRRVASLAASLAQRAGLDRRTWPPAREASPESSRLLLRALLSGWPDRVAQRRSPRSNRFVLADGGEVESSDTSLVRDAPLIVAIDARREARGGKSPRLFLASAIEAEWLIELENDAAMEGISESIEVGWNTDHDRVEAFSRLRFGRIILAQTRVPAESQPETSHLLASSLRESGLSALSDGPGVESLFARLEWLARLDPASAELSVDEEGLWAMVERACHGARARSELRTRRFAPALEGLLEARVRDRLRRWFPLQIDLPGRGRVPVRYVRGALPHVASRLQDFFGLRTTPCIADGRLPLQLHLLAPNGRPVQITQDLSGFWSRHYPQVRKELRGRYPKHAWPEKP